MEIKQKKYSSVLAAIIGTVISHPIDTLKTNQQISGLKINKVIKKLHSSNIKLLVRNYYRGLSFPLMFIPIEKGIVFNMNSYFFKKYNSHLISGLISGITAGFFVNFIENFKINQQNMITKNKKKPIQQYIKLINYKLFTQGLPHTLMREGLGYTIYFKVFNDYYKHIFPTFIAGGLSGVTAWVFIYPFDRIKTMVQSNTSTKNLNIYNIYRGCSLSLARAMLMHGTVFYLIEKINETILI